MAAAGLGDDLLLANEVLDARRLGARGRPARGSRSRSTRDGDRRRGRGAAACARCSSTSTSACRAAAARPRTPAGSPTWPGAAGSTVRGVMGYEGHVMLVADRAERRRRRPRSAWRCCAAAARRRRRRHRLGRRHRHLRHQHLGHRDPGRLVRADGHRVRRSSGCRSGRRCTVLATVDLGVERGPRLGGRRLRAQGARHGPRQPDASPARRCGSAPTSTSRSRRTSRAARASATGCGCCPRTSTRPSRCTSGCTSSTATTVVETWPVDLRGW